MRGGEHSQQVVDVLSRLTTTEEKAWNWAAHAPEVELIGDHGVQESKRCSAHMPVAGQSHLVCLLEAVSSTDLECPASGCALQCPATLKHVGQSCTIILYGM